MDFIVWESFSRLRVLCIGFGLSHPLFATPLDKWLSHESHSVEPMLPSTPMGQFSSPPPPPPQSMDPTSSYQHDNVQQPPRLYTPIQAQQRTQDGVENTSGGSDFSHQYLQQEQPQHSIYDHRSKTICTNTSYDR